MEQDNKSNMHDGVFSKKVRAGRRRTYFFDVRTTRSNDYYLTITESKKRFDDDGYERHKLFLYKEDFNKFLEALQETVDHVKTELLPEYDFDEFSHQGGEGDFDDDFDFGEPGTTKAKSKEDEHEQPKSEADKDEKGKQKDEDLDEDAMKW